MGLSSPFGVRSAKNDPEPESAKTGRAGGDLANGQLLVSAVGWADALLQGLVLLAKRDDAAGY